jgi:hypothetical protein
MGEQNRSKWPWCKGYLLRPPHKDKKEGCDSYLNKYNCKINISCSNLQPQNLYNVAASKNCYNYKKWKIKSEIKAHKIYLA